MVRGYSAWQRRHGLELSSANLNAINKLLLLPPSPLLQVKELKRDRGERLWGGGGGGGMCFNLVQWKRTIRSAIFDGVGSPGYCARCRYDYSYSPRACTVMMKVGIEIGSDRGR